MKQTFDNSKLFIVAEASKSWKDGHEITPGLISQKFEEIIEVNLKRGYGLHSWQFKQSVLTTNPVEVNETIIAVFSKIGASWELCAKALERKE